MMYLNLGLLSPFSHAIFVLRGRKGVSFGNKKDIKIFCSRRKLLPHLVGSRAVDAYPNYFAIAFACILNLGLQNFSFIFGPPRLPCVLLFLGPSQDALPSLACGYPLLRPRCTTLLGPSRPLFPTQSLYLAHA